MMQFVPQWITPAQTSLDDGNPITEGRLLAYQLRTEDVASGSFDLSSPIRFRGRVGDVSTVLVDGQQIAPSQWSIAGNVMRIAGINRVALLTVKRRSGVSHTLLAGDLPTGLEITPEGILTGVAADLTNGLRTYRITVRADNGTRVRDRSFVLQTTNVAAEQNISRTGLPSQQTDPIGSFDFYNLGTFDRAEGVLKTIELTGRGRRTIAILASQLSGAFTEGLPTGLSARGTTITGTIAPNCPAGRYVFRVAVADQPVTALSSFIGEIVVSDDLAVYVEKPTIIDWQTPAGSLGEVDEGYSLALNIKARHNTGAISYGLAPSSLPLPSGMRINVTTGEIEGIAPHVIRDTVYRFVVRASQGGNFVDRDFSFTVRSRYTTDAILDVRLKLRQIDQVPMVKRYADLIDPVTLFRADDPSYGFQSEPFFYLIKGINAAAFEQALRGQDARAITTSTDYHGPMDLVLGQHRSAVVRNSGGDIIHEVIYREVIDPQGKAGGFKFTADQVVEEQVIHAQTGRIVYATSIRNARYDLVRDCGFPSVNPALRSSIGINTAESLPKWMTSQQPDTNQPLGYTSGFVVAYVLPGRAAEMVKLLNRDTALPPVGRQMTLDRYYLYRITYSAVTSFDITGTTFDGGKKFDFSIQNDEKTVQV